MRFARISLLAALISHTKGHFASSMAAVPCDLDDDKMLLRLSLITDQNPADTSWTVRDDSTGAVVVSSGEYRGRLTTYHERICLSKSKAYTFTIYDASGDGICCGQGHGSYSLYLDGVPLHSGGDFRHEESTAVIEAEPAACADGNVLLELSLTTDQHPVETSWIILYASSGHVLSTGGEYGGALTTYNETICLSPSWVYDFVIFDTHGDGICCDVGDGSYSLFLDGVLLHSGGDFGSQETTEIST